MSGHELPRRTRITDSGSGYGSGSSRTALITLNIAVFAPMPSASVSRTIAVNRGAFRSDRIA